MQPLIHVHLAEDIPRLATLLKSKLAQDETFYVTGHALDGEQLLTQLASLPSLPHVVLMDIKMPRLDGIATTSRLKARHPQVKIIMTTVFDDDDHIFKAILAGADGYLLKDAEPEQLHRSIREALTGGAPMSPSVARRALLLLRQAPTPLTPTTTTTTTDLSLREQEILEHLSLGLRYREIAANLHLSEGTIRKHIENIYRKLQVHNKIAAIDKGRDLGIIG
ncbi:response regulator [Lewinella sp. LCG006]|uniref:response regulator n=1 Tax=Lewinella sp. LCG006 TaxID=3231911 RepID=UPI00345FB6E1